MELKVLVLDDDKISVMINNNILKRALFCSDAVLFSEGADALEYILNHNSSNITYCIFLDINMPLMNGWEFLDALDKEEIKAQISVVIVSSSIDFYDKQKAIFYNKVIAYYEKPLGMKNIEELKHHTNFKSCFD